jgi:hypothetical protein
MYEPLQTMQPQPPSVLGSQPHQFAAKPPVDQSAQANNVQVPEPSAKPSKWEDISDYGEMTDFIYIVIAVLLVDVLLLFLIRFFPGFFGKSINVWYNRFKLNAVIADVGIIVIGFALARYIYSEYIYPTYDWNALYFTLTTVVTQILHDIGFYFGVVKPIPAGHNAMIDIFKVYGEEVGVKGIATDSAMMILSSGLAMLLKSAPAHVTGLVGMIGLYIVPYLLETRNQYSVIS